MPAPKLKKTRRKRQGKGGGPKSRSGKLAVRQNALQHGGYASLATGLLPHEDPGDWLALKQTTRDKLQPRDDAETELADQLSWIRFKQRRLATYENSASLLKLHSNSLRAQRRNESAIMQNAPPPPDEAIINGLAALPAEEARDAAMRVGHHLRREARAILEELKMLRELDT